MNNSFAETGLKFFGTVSASISHEIKNRMAVINEQAGLLKDLVLLAGQGKEINLERLMRLAESFKTQVDLTDGIIKNMNRFAHAVDSFRGTADVGDVLSLTAALAKRTADNKGARIEVRLSDPPVSVVTAPFVLMNLIWVCMEVMMPFSDMENPVVISFEKNDTGAGISVSTDVRAGPEVPVLPETVAALSAAVDAEVVVNSVEKGIKINLPEKVFSQQAL